MKKRRRKTPSDTSTRRAETRSAIWRRVLFALLIGFVSSASALPTMPRSPPKTRPPAAQPRCISRSWPPPAPNRLQLRLPSLKEITEAIQRGIQFLLDDQRPDGSWGSPEQTKGLNIYAPPPGAHDAFKSGVTGLAMMALIEAESHVSEEQRPLVSNAILRGEQWLDEKLPRLRAQRPMPSTTPGVTLMRSRPWCGSIARAAGQEERQAQLKKLCADQVDMLSRYSFLAGGWGYYDFEYGTQIPGDASNSFVTATVLIALRDAKCIGIDFPERLTKKAIASILRQQYPDFSYAYGEYLRTRCRWTDQSPRRQPGPLAGLQSRAANVRRRARHRRSHRRRGSNRLFARNGWLSIGRKRPIPHESHFSVAGYFYYYGHCYAAPVHRRAARRTSGRTSRITWPTS